MNIYESIKRFYIIIAISCSLKSNNNNNICILAARGTKCTDQIIIGTPGSLLDWVLRHRAFDPKKISIFVLDEADVMISQQGHQDQSIRIKK